VFALDGPARLAALRATGLLDSAPEQVFDDLTALVARLLRVPVALLSLVDDQHQFFKSARGLASPWAERRQTPLSHSFCQHAVARGGQLVVTNAPLDPLVADNLAIPDLGFIAYAGVPVEAESQPIGVLCAIDTSPRDWTEDELAVLRMLAAMASRELERRRAVERLAELADELVTAQKLLEEAAVKDALTGLYNRRGFFELANLTMQLADRTRRPLALFYVDLDGMKTINDTHGHAAGDEALRETAAILRASFRSTDIVARLGGDEFVVLAIECADEASAIGLLQRLHDTITDRNQKDGVSYTLAASAGLTFYDPARGRRYLESLLAECDQRMFVAKQSRKPR
jgi:diguanylate cyclase (GGDEF)-like protein